MKFFFDFLPVILFFVTFKLYGIYIATTTAIAASIIQVIYLYLSNKKVGKAPIITMLLLVVMGGATIYFQDEIFIKWKPSVLNWLLAMTFLLSFWLGKGNMCKRLMGGKINLPDNVWCKLNWAWVFFFIISGLLNIFVAYNYSLNFWVNFKLFGLIGMTLLFVIAQVFYLRAYLKDFKN